MDNKRIGEFIKVQRALIGLTQKQLAEKIGVTDKAISRWETGKGIPDVSLLIPLSDVLEVSVNELLNGEKIEEDKMIEKCEETIVNTLKSSKKKISKLNCIIFALFVAVEVTAIYGITMSAQPSDEMGLLLAPVLVITPVVSFLLGLTNISFKLKALFPWIVLISYFPSNYLYWDADPAFEIGIMYGFANLLVSYLLILIGIGINKLIKSIVQKKKK